MTLSTKGGALSVKGGAIGGLGPPELTWTRTEAATSPDPPFVANGLWFSGTNAAASGGNYIYAAEIGRTLVFSFTGAGVRILGIKISDGGIAAVSIDGGAPQDVDTYGAALEWQSVLFEESGLANGAHTVEIEVTGRSSPSSSGVSIYLDAFDVGTP